MRFQIFVNEIKSKRNTMMNTPHAIELHVLCKISILFFLCKVAGILYTCTVYIINIYQSYELRVYGFTRCEINTKTYFFQGIFHIFSPFYTHILLCTHAQALVNTKKSLVSPERVEKMSTCNWVGGGKEQNMVRKKADNTLEGRPVDTRSNKTQK